MTRDRSGIRWTLTLLFILALVGSSGVLIGTFIIAPTPAPVRATQADTASVGAATAPSTEASQVQDHFTREWGIEATTVRLTAGGNVLDFRYRIVDVERAAKLSEPQYEAHLLLHSQDKVNVVNPKRSGPLLEGKQKLRGGEYRSLFFQNPSLRVKTGDLVTVVIGDYRAEDLSVQ